MSFLKPKPVAAPAPVQAAPLPPMPEAPTAPPSTETVGAAKSVPKSPDAPPTFGTPAPKRPRAKSMQSSFVGSAQWGSPTNTGTKTLVGE